MSKALLSTTYFGPVQWYQKLYRHCECQIEQYESFVKQTYRNRCVIATEAGAQTLTLPVEHGAKLMRDIRISDHGEWRHLHWQALKSAYGESPFFEFYADDIRPFFERKWNFLLDYEMEITNKMCELLGVEANVTLTSEFEKEPLDVIDYRNAITPKHPQIDADFTSREYYQVYKQRHGFIANLSILDLLFNEGNEAILYLR